MPMPKDKLPIILRPFESFLCRPALVDNHRSRFDSRFLAGLRDSMLEHFSGRAVVTGSSNITGLLSPPDHCGLLSEPCGNSWAS